jgi:hypothetical protein
MAPLADLFNHGNVSSSYSFSPDAVRTRPTGTPRRRAATPERSDAAPAAAARLTQAAHTRLRRQSLLRLYAGQRVGAGEEVWPLAPRAHRAPCTAPGPRACADVGGLFAARA